jgi:hypothetical protein
MFTVAIDSYSSFLFSRLVLWFAGYPDTYFFLSSIRQILRLIFTTRRCVAIATKYALTGASILRLQRRPSFVGSEGLPLLDVSLLTRSQLTLIPGP